MLDPRSDRALTTVSVGEKLEYPVADDAGHVFIAGEEKGDVVELDAHAVALLME